MRQTRRFRFPIAVLILCVVSDQAAVAGTLGDVNGDDLVDLADHAALVACLMGPAVEPACEEGDFAPNGFIDLHDWAFFQRAFGPCSRNWTPGLFADGEFSDRVYHLQVLNLGASTELYAAGRFLMASGAPARFVARWTGVSWVELGDLSATGYAYALETFDDGSGLSLVAGGTFGFSGPTPYRHAVLRWGGTGWVPIAEVSNVVGGAVLSLTVHDDGAGPALYAGGQFYGLEGVFARNIAQWNGQNWSPLGEGLFGTPSVNFEPQVRALAVFDDGTGLALFAGGLFTNAGRVAASNIAKWDGGSWSDLAGGISNASPFDVATVSDLITFDDGTGMALYAAGLFSRAGTIPVVNVAKWDGVSWSATGNGMNSGCTDLAVFDDGTGPALHVTGGFTIAGGATANHVAKLVDGAWIPLGVGVNSSAWALAEHDEGDGQRLYVGGLFTSAGGMPVDYVARWDGASWSRMVGVGVDAAVYSLLADEMAATATLRIGGEFTTAGELPAGGVASWDTVSWTPLGIEADGSVHALQYFGEGTERALFAGGEFTEMSDHNVNYIARWSGSEWLGVGGGLNGPVYALVEFNDDNGLALYAGGAFTIADGAFARRLARWDGLAWAPVGGYLNNTVRSLTVFDDGNGPALYVGGDFTLAGGLSTGGIAKWNGAAWSALDSGVDGSVLSMAAFDDGTGMALYVGGSFMNAGGAGVGHIAKWDGTSWSALGDGFDGAVRALGVFDDGSGLKLYAGGDFLTSGGLLVNHVARWDGATWSTVENGANGAVHCMTTLTDDGGFSLYLGGEFTHVGGVTSRYLARIGCMH